MNKIKLDFCILNNPVDESKPPIIFITGRDKNFLDINVIDYEDYENAIFLIQEFGYIETDILTFEFSQDPDYPYITKKNIIKILEENGMKYNYDFEKFLKQDFDKIKNNLLYYSYSKQEKQKKTPYDYFFNNTHKFYIPDIGERITLYFYLFLECNFKKDKCFLNLNGNFFSSKNTDTTNFIKIIKSDFIRINNQYNPNKIILKSIKTNKDFIREIPLIHSGKFKKIQNDIEKTYMYYFIEISKNLFSTSRIKIEIENNHNFDVMIKYSKKIKKQFIEQNKKIYKTENILNTLKDCEVIVNEKMLDFAQKEEYEDAALLKQDLQYIIKKQQQLRHSNKEIFFKKLIKKIGIRY